MRSTNSSKEHVKLYKSKKNWVAATIFTASVGICSTVLIGNANADNVNSQMGNNVSSSSVTLATNTASKSNAVTLRSSQANNSSQTNSESNKVNGEQKITSSSQETGSAKETTKSMVSTNSKNEASVSSITKTTNEENTEDKSNTSNVVGKSSPSDFAIQESNPMAPQNSTSKNWQQGTANTYNDGLMSKVNQEAQQNQVTFQKQLSNAKALDVYNKLNDMGKKIAQAANLNLSNLSESEIEALNKVRVDGKTYDGQLTYAQYQQYGKTLIDEDKQFAIPKFDKNKIENFPAATTKDAQTGKTEALDIWDSWPVVHADNGVPVNYNGYELVIGMMGNGQDWNDGHLYLLYTKYGDNNFNDWKCAGPIFGFHATDQQQQWSGSATVNSDGSIQLYYTQDDLTDGNNHQQIATATVHITANDNGVAIDGVTNNKILFAGDGYYYQSYQQWKDSNDKLDNFCLRDPHVYEQNGKRYLIFEASTGTYNYQSNDQIYNLSNYGESTIAKDVQDLFSIINNKDMTHKASLANACIGLMKLGGTEEDPTIAKLYAPIVSTPMVTDEIERPVIVKIGGKYYLFTDTRLNRGIDDSLNNEANKKIGDNVGMLGFVSDSLDGNYKPLNGSGVVLTASAPNNARTSEYSWYAVPILDANGNETNYVLITAYMSNRDQAAGKGLNATWAPSFIVEILPNDTTRVVPGSVTEEQGIWVLNGNTKFVPVNNGSAIKVVNNKSDLSTRKDDHKVQKRHLGVLNLNTNANEVQADTVHGVRMANTNKLNNGTKNESTNEMPQTGETDSNKTVWGMLSVALASILAAFGFNRKRRR